MYDRKMFELLGMMLSEASPEIVEVVRQAVVVMAGQAAGTENPWDDMLAHVLELMVGEPGA